MSPPELRPYQVEARDFLRAHDEAALWLSVGLGKSAITLAALEPRHLPVLVLAPPRVASEVWPAEAALWRPDLTAIAATGGHEARMRALYSGADVVSLSDMSASDAIALAESGRFRTLVMDEHSRFKSPRVARTKAAVRIGRHVQHRWGLTGTPAPNGLMDVWAQAYTLDRGRTLGPSFPAFRNRYWAEGRKLRTGAVIEWVMRPGAEARIREQLAPLVLSMDTPGRVALPEFTRVVHPVTPGPLAVQVAQAIRDDGVASLPDGSVVTAPTAAEVSNRLCQIAAGFIYPDADERDPAQLVWHELDRAKLDRLAELREQADGPLLVFSRYRAERARIKADHPDAREVHDIAPGQLQAEWNAGRIPMLLAHPASVGHGLNLQSGPGHTVVYTSLVWSQEEWAQSLGRLHRSGQQRPVICHVLQATGTPDELVLGALDGKTDVQQALRDYFELIA